MTIQERRIRRDVAEAVGVAAVTVGSAKIVSEIGNFQLNGRGMVVGAAIVAGTELLARRAMRRHTRRSPQAKG